jgi:MFS family permease
MTTAPPPQAVGAGDEGALAVFRNRPFLLLWLAQAVTQIGGNMVLYGLVIIISESTQSTTAASALILSFLVPAVLFSAVAGVYVDRMDRRYVLVVTNVLRAVAFLAIWAVGDHLLAILLLTIFVSTVTVFFAPAEAAMIPFLVPRHHLLSANGVFTLTLNAAFALGFALLGPLFITVAGAQALILVVAGMYLVAALFCWVLPAAPPPALPVHSAGEAVADAERAVEKTLSELREGIAFIRSHRNITWSLVYLGVAASLVGVLGVLGPNFARFTLGLDEKDFVVVVLPLGIGIVMGILTLNSYGRYLPRRRVIEGGLIALGALLALLSIAGPISQFLRRAQQGVELGPELSIVTSLLAVVVAIAFAAGLAYGFVAIPAQTQLQEDLPEDVRGRVFGVLNMLVSVASFLPIIVVGPIADLVGTGAVILFVAIFIAVAGVASVVQRGPLGEAESHATAEAMVPGAAVEPIGVVTHAEPLPIDPSAPDDEGIAPWMRAAGWGRPQAAVEPDSPPDASPEPPPGPVPLHPSSQATNPATDPIASEGAPWDLASADPMGIAPDDPRAMTRAQQAETTEMRLPWGAEVEDGGPDADAAAPVDEGARRRTPPSDG